jgi:hypothetical protein
VRTGDVTMTGGAIGGATNGGAIRTGLGVVVRGDGVTPTGTGTYSGRM